MRGASRVELTRLIRYDGENAGHAGELDRLIRRETGREASDGAVVGVEDLLGGGAVRGGREGLEDRGVPVVVGGEERGLLRFRHVDDEGLWTVR